MVSEDFALLTCTKILKITSNELLNSNTLRFLVLLLQMLIVVITVTIMRLIVKKN